MKAMKKNMEKILSISFLCMFVLLSCKCPIDIDTPSQTEPKDFANVLILNCSTNYDYLIVGSLGLQTPFSAAYDTLKGIGTKLPAGFNSVRIINSTDSAFVFNGFTNFTKNMNYLMLVSGKGLHSNILTICDTLQNNSKDAAYLRCINLCPELSSVDFITENFVRSLGYGEFSYPAAVSTGIDYFRITSSAIQPIIISNLSLQAGKVYNIILRGEVNGRENRKLEYKIIESL
jgi:hypothetical protein